jgi:hypothetical protein
VPRPCSRRAMRPHLGVRLTRVTVPAPSVRALDAGVAGAVTPGDDAQAAYPTPSTSYNLRASGAYYVEGRALDGMITDSPVGWNIAEWAGATAARLGVGEVIYRRTSGPCSGFGGLASDVDRGSPTAKQMENVHVSVCCDSGTA